jgi:putative PIN family toxin of toxin-antitoxin system
VLGREKFNRYVLQEEREHCLGALLREAIVVDTMEVVRACRDPKDDMYLELAVSGKATCIVSGDQDLLLLNPFRGIPIITPDEFLTSFEK